MIEYQHWQLENGLTVLLNTDNNTPLVAVNMMYNVGAKDEDPEQTGLAHLFEHLMFSGSKNAPDYDKLLQKAGGENNAFTSNDVTNYYAVVPKENFELALFLEADRMRDMNLDQKALDVQKKVVIEEFKQRYLNQPYGDVWLNLRKLCYNVHPYQWATIGKSIEQIESVTIDHARNFYQRFYAPNNAVLSISGNVTEKEVRTLVDQYFGHQTNSQINRRKRELEKPQTARKELSLSGKVPSDAYYIAFHIEGKGSKSCNIGELLSDILAGSGSSRLYHELVKDQKLFGEINSYVSGEFDCALFIITGKLNTDVTFEVAENAIRKALKELLEQGLEEDELTKVINKKITAEVYTDMQILNKAMKMAYAFTSNQLERLNDTIKELQEISEEDVIKFIQTNLSDEKSNHLFYQAVN